MFHAVFPLFALEIFLLTSSEQCKFKVPIPPGIILYPIESL
nr:MAG TPA: hypothetical protein [Bacteriophage sp.]